jgi:dienelactone hydrolase
LQNIASYGFLAIAEGGPNGGGTSNAQTMKAAIDWVTKTAGTGAYANVNASKIMAAGFSCGGVEAMDNIWDSRVDTVGVISSGLLQNQTAARDWRKPVLFVLGGSGDIAFQNVSYSKLSIKSLEGAPDTDSRPYRASATSRTSLLVFPLGRATSRSAMAVRSAMRTVVVSAKRSLTGCCGL